MRTIQVNLYQFNELSDSAKENARGWWRSIGDCVWCDESIASLKAFCDHFNVKLTDWEVDQWRYSFRTDADQHHFRGRKLKDFDREHAPTGYCLDCDLWMTFYDEFKRTGNAKGAFESALDAGFHSWMKDLEWQDSDEYIDEHLEANEYEFTEDGERA